MSKVPKYIERAVEGTTCPEHGYRLKTNLWFEKETCSDCEVAWGKWSHLDDKAIAARKKMERDNG